MPQPPLLPIAGFVLAGYAVIGNDALQTLGPFLAANRGRIPKLLQWLWLAGLLALVLLLGWWQRDGDPAWGRLDGFAPAAGGDWLDLLPPLSVLLLTRCGAPVSTSFLVLTAFAPASLGPLLRHSLAGYGAGFAAGLLVWGLPLRLPERAPALPQSLWLVLQWLTTGWLWSQWLVQDLANIYVTLPRRLEGWAMAGSLLVLLLALALLLVEDGGAIQQRLTTKSHSDDPRVATLLAAVQGLVLFSLSQLSRVPLSTTWVFLGLLGGRELALLRLGERPFAAVARGLAADLLWAGLGLGVSVAVALAVQAARARL